MKGRLSALVLLVVVLLAPLVAVPLVVSGYARARCAPVAAVRPADQSARELVGGLDVEQMGNAAVIVEMATQVVARPLTEEAAVIGVMTALTESSLRNLAYGDAAGPDSRGLFQQRDSWGALDVRMDPAGAARLFFGALVAVPGWQSMDPWAVAQAVQRSAFTGGQNYAPNYRIAQRVVAILTQHTADTGNWSRANLIAGCETASAWLHGDDDGQRLPVRVPGSEAAVARAHAMVGRRGYHQLCARLAAHIWGRSHSGYASAAEQWDAMVATGNAHPAHDDDRRPPVGVLLFWDTGGPYGHVAVYVGEGRIVSNDIGDTTPGEGGVYLVEVTAVEARWGGSYLGWSPPVYATPNAT